MRRYAVFVVSAIFSLGLVSCMVEKHHDLTPEPGLSMTQPIPSQSSPTQVQSTLNESQISSPIVTQTLEISFPFPQGIPLISWHEIPIPSAAIAGDVINDSGLEGIYTYTIRASADSIEEFYLYSMSNLGWCPLYSDEPMDFYMRHVLFCRKLGSVEVLIGIFDPEREEGVIQVVIGETIVFQDPPCGVWFCSE